MIDRIRDWSYTRQSMGKEGNNLLQILKDVVAVYSSQPSAPLSLFARAKFFNEREYQQLDADRMAYRIPAMRESVHLLPAETAHLVSTAVLPLPDDPYWEKRYSHQQRKIPPNEYPGWRSAVNDALHEPRTVDEIKKMHVLPDEVVKFILNRMAFEGDVLRIGAESLRSNIISYVAKAAWTGKAKLKADSGESLAWLAEQYLRAFGPCRVKDFQWWTGLTVKKAKTAISSCNTVELEEGLLLLNKDMADFESHKKRAEDRIDLLPQWDCYTMGYAPDGRERFVSPDVQEKMFGKLGATRGNALGVVMINGLVHGTWSFRFKAGSMINKLGMFVHPTNKVLEIIEEKIHEVAVLLKAKRVTLEQ